MMPILIPTRGTEINVAQFGEPVATAVNQNVTDIAALKAGSPRAGFTRTSDTGPTNVGAVPTAVALPLLRDSAGGAFTANAGNTVFTCAVPGLYLVTVTGFAGNQIPPSGTFIGIHIDGLMRTRDFLRSSQPTTVAYITFQTAITWPFIVGTTVSYMCAAGSGTFSFGVAAWPGSSTDGPAPMLSAWRISA